ncbi:peptide/nickel transport system permease protein [Nesterenkonia sandarakina]|uniref:Peptide/nickel transport system permease protein n=1 Tax=Nesterenkonia sandarakina TaxID=272918 RepID=A0A2T0YBN2_9MICC|nr:peptide/nickel transport system permease protein [Nesterenkonia sandarakina]
MLQRFQRQGWAALNHMVIPASRLLSVAAVVLLVGLLPWMSGSSAEYTILRARYADLPATQENLALVSAELGLDRGPLVIFWDWASAMMRGDAGESWISGRPVLPGVTDALGVSLTLMGFAIIIALLLACALCVPVLIAGLRGRSARGSGAAAAAFTALPEFLLAASLLVIGSVWLGWFPPYGWQGAQHAVLPALALGIPGGGLIGRLTVEAINQTFAERWTVTWQMAGASHRVLLTAVLRRSLPAVLGQVGLVLIGLTGGAVAVEQVFAIPGLGRLTLGAATSQDIPALQAGMLALVIIAILIGSATGLARRALLGPALRHDAVPVQMPQRSRRTRDLIVPGLAGVALLLLTVAGTFRDAYSAVNGRLTAPSLMLPLGSDATGRDILARVGQGTWTTLGTALAVVFACLLIGLFLGCFPRLSAGPAEVTNAAPPIIAGLLVAAVSGPSVLGAAVAITAVSWAPLAVYTAGLVTEMSSRTHIKMLPLLGVGRVRIMVHHVLPAVIGPVTRHAMLRLPGIALALAALSFLGLGAQPPAPEWGLVLAEGMSYVERAPWTVVGPASALILASVLAVSLSSLPTRPKKKPHRRASATSAEYSQPVG